MRAVTVRSFGNIAAVRVEDVADPSPEPGEVLIQVEAADTNYPDLLVVDGRYQVKPPVPFSPGKAAAGRVIALGRDVTKFKLGGRVTAQVEYGAYAEKLRAPETSCWLIPDDVSAIDAAAMGLTYQTAWFALTHRASFKPSETVLVLGAAGGIGVACIQLAKALGAGLVIGATRGATKLDTVRAAGADHVIDIAVPDIHNGLREAVRARTGRGIDIVLDPVGGAATDAALRALNWCGRLVVIGFAAGDIPTLRANYLLVKNISVSGLQWSDYRDRTPELVADAQKHIFDLKRRGLINPIVTRTLPLERFGEALAEMQAGTIQGKTVLVPAD